MINIHYITSIPMTLKIGTSIPRSRFYATKNTGKVAHANSKQKTKSVEPKGRFVKKKNISNQSFKMMDLKHLTLFKQILNSLLKESNLINKYTINDRKDFSIDKCISCVFKTYDSLILHHGCKSGSKLWKEFRNYTLRQSRGQSLSKISYSTATGKVDRVISKFNELRPLIFASIDGCPKAYQILNSLLYTTRVDTRLPDTKYSLDVVTGETFINSEALRLYGDWIERKFNNGSYKKPKLSMAQKPSKFGDLPLSVSSPTGDTNFKSLDSQAWNLVNSDLWPSFKNLAYHLKDSELVTYLENYSKELELESKDKIERKPLRRITRVSDSDIKDRIIAIVDTYSQLLGGKVQKLLYWSLKSNHIKHTDVFDHSEGAKVLVKPTCYTTFASPGESYILKCLDASDWTWCFRKEPQLLYLKACVGQGIADPFKPLFIDCPWATDKEKTGHETVITKSGQAMGTKSSFVLATVTSISILEAACEGVFDKFLDDKDQEVLMSANLFGKPCHKMFRETGDDTLIYDYCNRMQRALELFGVSFNQFKSISSMEYPSGNIELFTEYLSRTALNRCDVSRVSLRLCRLAESHYTYMPMLLAHLHERAAIGSVNSESISSIWMKNGELIRDKHGRDWLENLKLILTLENPTKLPHELILKMNLISDNVDDDYIAQYPQYKLFFLIDSLIEKIEKQIPILNNNWQLYFERRIAEFEDEMPVRHINGTLITPVVWMWQAKLYSVSSVIDRLIEKVAGLISPEESDKGIAEALLDDDLTAEEHMSRTMLIRSNKRRLMLACSKIDPTDLEGSAEFINLLVNEVDLIDGTYPSYKDRTAHYKNLSSLCVRIFNGNDTIKADIDSIVNENSSIEIDKDQPTVPPVG